MLAVLQANVGRGATVMSQLIKFADRQKIDIIMLQEPYTREDHVAGINSEFTVLESNQLQPTTGTTQLSSPSQQQPSPLPAPFARNRHLSSPYRPKAACLIRRNVSGYLLDQECSNVNMTVVVFDQEVFVSLYCNAKNSDKTNRTMNDDLKSLDRVLAKHKNRRIAIFMDSNCHHVTMGGQTNDERGEELVSYLCERELVCVNQPEQGATYVKWVNGKEHRTFIDLTLVNKKMLERVAGWSIERKAMITEHAAIVARFESRKREATFTRRFIDHERTDWNKFFDIYNSRKPQSFERKGFEKRFRQFDKAVRRAFNKAVKVRERTYYESMPWYNEELAERQEQIMKKKRKLSRIGDEGNRISVREELRQLNKVFAEQLKICKCEYYEKKSEDVKNSEQFWRTYASSKPYQPTDIPMFATNRTGTLEENTRILASQFVRSPTRPYARIKTQRDLRLRGTDREELSKIISDLNNNKAPGIDRVTNKLIKIMFARDGEYITMMFNKLLEFGRIPANWKCGRMIFFRKPGKDPSEPKGYRPITLISGWCKLAECLFIDRIEQDLGERNFFCPSQYGFRKGFSTIDAIRQLINQIKKKRKSKKNVVLVVAIDISGAFDSISWTTIVRNVINAHCDDSIVNACESLLTGRKIQINGKTFESEKGTPQGGRASPALFRIGLNSLLHRLTEQKIAHVGYADDLALVLSATSQSELQRKLDEAFELIRGWCSDADLTVNEQKTEFLLTTRKKKLSWKLKVGDNEIRTADHIKYLGVIIDRRLSWKQHIEHIDQKISVMTERVRRFSWMRSELEWKFKRMLYFNVFLPTLTYASTIWYGDIAKKVTYLERLRRIQRRFVIAASGAYKCTPKEELMSLLGLTDVISELEILNEGEELSGHEKRSLKYQRRTETIEQSKRFHHTLNKLNPDKINNKHVIWCISGCGPFKQFLNRIGKADDFWCRYCGSAIEDASHLLFDCESLNIHLNNNLDTSELNRECTNLVRKLHRDENRL